MALDIAALYREYLTRFDRKLGVVDVGAFAKFEGKLIKKLSAHEFEVAFAEYHEIAERYYEGVEKGDTINDVVWKLLRDKAAELILEPPKR